MNIKQFLLLICLGLLATTNTTLPMLRAGKFAGRSAAPAARMAVHTAEVARPQQAARTFWSSAKEAVKPEEPVKQSSWWSWSKAKVEAPKEKSTWRPTWCNCAKGVIGTAWMYPFVSDAYERYPQLDEAWQIKKIEDEDWRIDLRIQCLEETIASDQKEQAKIIKKLEKKEATAIEKRAKAFLKKRRAGSEKPRNQQKSTTNQLSHMVAEQAPDTVKQSKDHASSIDVRAKAFLTTRADQKELTLLKKAQETQPLVEQAAKKLLAIDNDPKEIENLRVRFNTQASPLPFLPTKFGKEFYSTPNTIYVPLESSVETHQLNPYEVVAAGNQDQINMVRGALGHEKNHAQNRDHHKRVIARCAIPATIQVSAVTAMEMGKKIFNIVSPFKKVEPLLWCAGAGIKYLAAQIGIKEYYRYGERQADRIKTQDPEVFKAMVTLFKDHDQLEQKDFDELVHNAHSKNKKILEQEKEKINLSKDSPEEKQKKLEAIEKAEQKAETFIQWVRSSKSFLEGVYYLFAADHPTDQERAATAERYYQEALAKQRAKEQKAHFTVQPKETSFKEK